MNDELALLAAIIAQPEEDTPRLAFADWLDEHGQPARAEFIRVQIELTRLPAAERETPHYRTRLTRFRQLIAKHAENWVAVLGVPRQRAIFRRGFIEEVRFEPEEVPEGGNPALAHEPLRFVTVTSLRRNGARSLLSESVLRRLASWPGHGRFDTLEFEALDVPDDMIELFFGSPAAAKLRVLEAPACFTPEGAVALAESGHLTHLERLNFGPMHLNAELVLALARTRGLPRLRVLEVALQGDAAEPDPLSDAYGELVARFGSGVSLSRW